MFHPFRLEPQMAERQHWIEPSAVGDGHPRVISRTIERTGASMSSEHNKRIVRRIFEEAMNHGQTELYRELIHPEYVNHDFPAPVGGIEGFMIVDGMFRAAFPDFQVVVEDVVAEGDHVATRGHFTGTHRGEFMGMPPTGRTFHCTYSDIWRLEGGKGYENWVQMDMLGLMQQLGGG
jgi:predicted ester cyclase